MLVEFCVWDFLNKSCQNWSQAYFHVLFYGVLNNITVITVLSMLSGSVSLICLVFCVVLMPCLSPFYVMCPMLPVSIDCPFLITPSVFFKLYLCSGEWNRRTQRNHCSIASPCKSGRNEMKLCLIGQEEFEDTKGAIRIRISKKNRQHNDQ